MKAMGGANPAATSQAGQAGLAAGQGLAAVPRGQGFLAG